jgi:arginine exporter protein ArgO
MTAITEIFAYIFGFLCIYIFLYILLGFFFQDSSHEEFQKTLSRSLDIFMAVVVLTIGLTLFFSLSTLGNDKEVISQTLQD